MSVEFALRALRTRAKPFARLLPLALIGAFTCGCATPGQTAGLVVGVTALLGQSPAQEIQQVYYLGIFDPQEQLPSSVYRVTVHGQGSAMSFVRFASGWAPASMIDTLNTNIGFNNKTGDFEITGKGQDSGIETGRRLMLFGPEGFREAPRDHRLVIVMGQNPEAFFDAIGSGLETVAAVQQEKLDSTATQALDAEFRRLVAERDRLQDLKADLKADNAAQQSTPAQGSN